MAETVAISGDSEVLRGDGDGCAVSLALLFWGLSAANSDALNSVGALGSHANLELSRPCLMLLGAEYCGNYCLDLSLAESLLTLLPRVVSLSESS